MAYLFDDANNQYFYASTSITGYPFTLAAWYNTNESTGYARRNIVALSDVDDTYDSDRLACYPAGNVDLACIVARTTTNFDAGFEAASTAGSMDANVWQHACGVFTSASARAAFVNGVNKGTNANEITPNARDTVTIGGSLQSGGVSTPMSGMIAEVAVWSVALTDAEVAELGDGASPLTVRPESLVHYWPLVRDLNDRIGGATLTASASAAAVADHPRVWYPAPMWVGLGGVTSGSPSASESASESATPSTSESASESASASPSSTPSASESGTPSTSESASPSTSESASPSATPSTSESASPSGESASESMSESGSPSSTPSASESGTPSTSESASPSSTPSASESISESASISPSMSESASPSPGPTGETCWGHVTGVLEDNARTFNGNWTGTGAVENPGANDNERLALEPGEYMISEMVYTDAILCQLLQNEYAAGDTVLLQYRTGATAATCNGAEWTTYTVPFDSLGYVQVRVESTL
jgi:hypothetical protein